MGDLYFELRKLENELERINSPLLSYLQRGLNVEEIQHKINGIISFSEKVYKLYNWRNGISNEYLESKTLGELMLFRMGVFPNLEIVLEEYNEHTKFGYWEQFLFPLFGSGGGDYFLINCDPVSSSYNRIFFYSPTDPDFDQTIPIFDSVETLIKSILECYEKRVYSINLNGQLNIDYQAEYAIFQRNNPESEYWRLGS